MDQPEKPIDRCFVPADRLHAVLEYLSEDDRLKGIFTGEPLESLAVSVEDGEPRVTLAENVQVSEVDSKLIEECVREAFAQAARQEFVGETPRAPGLASHMGSPRPHVVAARSHLDAGNPGRALTVTDDALRRWPEHAELHTYRAVTLTALGRQSEAIDAYREAIRRDPESVFAHVGAAQLLAREHRWEEAGACARSGLQADADEPTLLYILALSHEHDGLLRDALAALRRATEIDPQIPGADEDLARIEQALTAEVDVELVEEFPEPPVEDEIEVEFLPDPPASDAPASPAEPDEDSPAADARWGVAAAAPPNRETTQCATCGAENSTLASFCIGCGNRL